LPSQQPTSDFVADDFETTSSLLAAQRGQTIEVVNQAGRLMSAIAVGGVTAVITLWTVPDLVDTRVVDCR
jgi:hypothetical protein